ncbi:MAG: hypothetical protein R3F29_04675 [Planctomycetota bacterium]
MRLDLRTGMLVVILAAASAVALYFLILGGEAPPSSPPQRNEDRERGRQAIAVDSSAVTQGVRTPVREASGVVEITVVDDSTGAAVPGAAIWCSDSLGRVVSPDRIVAETNANGKCAVYVAPGYWGVHSRGFVSAAIDQEQLRQPAIEVRLSRGLSLAVRAVDLEGNALSGLRLVASRAQVLLCSPADMSIPFAGNNAAAHLVRSSDDGVCRFEGLAPGTYDVRPADDQGWIRCFRLGREEPSLRASSAVVPVDLRFARIVGCAVKFEGDELLRAELASKVPTTDMIEKSLLLDGIRKRIQDAAPDGVRVHVSIAPANGAGQATLVCCTASGGWEQRSIRLVPIEDVLSQVQTLSFPQNASRAGSLTVRVADAAGRSWDDLPLSCVAEGAASVVDGLPWAVEAGQPVRLLAGRYKLTSSDRTIQRCLENAGTVVEVLPGEAAEVAVDLAESLCRIELQLTADSVAPLRYSIAFRNSGGRGGGVLASVPNSQPMWVVEGEMLQGSVRAFGYCDIEVQLVGKGGDHRQELRLVPGGS